MNKPNRRSCTKKRGGGFSLLEMLVAILVLGTAMIGGLSMMVLGLARNTSTRTDTTAANVAQTILEDIASAPPLSNPTLKITDCTGQILTITTALGPGGAAAGAPLVVGPGLPGINPGDIDFTAAPVPNYSATYVMCGPNGITFNYDVRWNVQQVAGQNWAKLITIAARQGLITSGGHLYYSPPVTLQTVVGM